MGTTRDSFPIPRLVRVSLSSMFVIVPEDTVLQAQVPSRLSQPLSLMLTLQEAIV